MDADHSHDDLLDDGGDWSSSSSYESDGFSCALDESHPYSDSVLQVRIVEGSGPSQWLCKLNKVWFPSGVLTREFQWVRGVCEACIPHVKDMAEQVYQMWQRVNADLCKKQEEVHALNASPASASASASASAPASASASSSAFTSASAPMSSATERSKRKTENVVVVTDSDSDVEVTAPSRPAKKPKH
jgi:hypothetical protein